MVADKDANFTGLLCHLGEGPGRRSPNLPIVEADKADVVLGIERANQRCHRNAFVHHFINGVCNDGVLSGDQTNRVVGFTEGTDLISDSFGRQVVEVFQREFDPTLADIVRCGLDCVPEISVEGPPFLLQQYANSIGLPPRMSGLFNGTHTVKTELQRRI